MRRSILQLSFAFLILFPVCLISIAHADSKADIQAQINDRSQKIDQIQSDIAALQKQLDQVSGQKQTLQNTIKSLDLSNQKLTAQVKLTQTQISKTDLQIQTLAGTIATTSDQISQDNESVAGALRNLNQSDRYPVALVLLSGDTLSSIFDEVAALAAERDALQRDIEELSSLKTNLQTSKSAAEQKRVQLASLRADLSGQQKALAASIAAEKQLLAQTKNQESTYQQLIAQKKAQQAKFEQDLETFQSQLKDTVDVATLPHPGSGVLAWPFSDTYMQNCKTRSAALGNSFCITQYFGDTAFATQNPQIYNGHGHSGMDIAASIGTPIQSSGNGIVLGSGNTDTTCPGASYGKWILIKHDNGLATLYAHLSVISATTGARVGRGDVIGYSGFTGYATGPHLHFGVFAADAVQIASFASKGCPGKTYTMPVAPLSAYLNPLSYL